jgi:type IV pilus biogenesis protein CpaD/CtpE
VRQLMATETNKNGIFMRIMPSLLSVVLIAAALVLASCKPEDTSSSATEPTYQETTILETGTILHATIYNGPSTQTDRTRINTFLNGKITIYSNDLVVITDTSGYKHAAPLEWCADLVYK